MGFLNLRAYRGENQRKGRTKIFEKYDSLLVLKDGSGLNCGFDGDFSLIKK